MAPLRLPPKKPLPPVKVPQARGAPVQVAPSSARTTSPAQARRGLSEQSRAQILSAGKAAVVAGGTAVVLYTGGRSVESFYNARAADRDASRARYDLLPVPFDANGDGIPDGTSNVPIVLGTDGAYDVYGATPTHSQDARTAGGEIRATTKTVGVVLVVVLVAGAGVYILTRPGVAKKLAGVMR